MIDISVKVPEDRVAEFYAMYGSWLKSSPGYGFDGSDDESPDLVDQPATAWRPDDLELATAVWHQFSARAQALFSTLIDSPNERYYGEELARMHHIPNGSHGIAGLLTWPSRHCAAAGRSWCWKWNNPDRGGTVYWMDDELASLFSQARNESQAEASSLSS